MNKPTAMENDDTNQRRLQKINAKRYCILIRQSISLNLKHSHTTGCLG